MTRFGCLSGSPGLVGVVGRRVGEDLERGRTAIASFGHVASVPALKELSIIGGGAGGVICLNGGDDVFPGKLAAVNDAVG